MTASSDGTIVRTRHPRFPAAVTLRLNRPDRKNALRPEEAAALGRHLAELQTDIDTRLIVITGTGDAFCAGADINVLNTLSGDALAAFIEAQIDVLARVVMTPKIVVAAVNGACSGFGNHLVTCCDLALAHERAVLHFTGAAKSLPSLLLGTLVMPMTIGLKRAKSLYLRGGRLTAQQAVADGLCNEVVADARWEAALDSLAAEFAGRAAATMAHNKALLNQGTLQMLGALKLSALAGAASLSSRNDIPTGRAA